MDMVTCLQCLHPTITRTTLRQFHRIALAMVVMTGRVTMLGLSRWAGSGGSYRTVQRFFATVIPWATLFWVFFRQHVYRPGDVYLVAGDAVVATKAGKHTPWAGSVFCASLRQAGTRAGVADRGRKKPGHCCPGDPAPRTHSDSDPPSRIVVAKRGPAPALRAEGAEAGIYSAGLRRREDESRVVFGGIQSIYRRMNALPRLVCSATSSWMNATECPRRLRPSMYGTVFDACPGAQCIGLSATPSTGSMVGSYMRDLTPGSPACPCTSASGTSPRSGWRPW